MNEKIFNTNGGSNPGEAKAFLAKLWDLVRLAQEENDAFDIDITLTYQDEKFTLKAFDDAALVDGVSEAVKDYLYNIS